MSIALFVPCYINQLFPQVAIATLELLERSGMRVTFPPGQVCCGQPMANSGFESMSAGCHQRFADVFSDFDYIVCPSGSCTLHLKEHAKSGGVDLLSPGRIFELTEFLTDVVGVASLRARFPHRVALHQSCHGQRGLGLSSMSERVGTPFSKPADLLRKVEGLTLVEMSRVDECCGFGGTFAVAEEAVSVAMGRDRIDDFLDHDAEYVTGVDVSCLMHLDGIALRSGKKLKTIHIAEILNAR